MKVFKEKSGERDWALRLVESGDGTVALDAVDCETGEWLATLAEISSDGIAATECAREALDDELYDVSFVEWGDGGKIAIR